MARNIVLVIGHPDPSPRCYLRILANAYADGAREGGHSVHIIDVATLDFPLLRTQREWKTKPVPEGLRDAQRDLMRADHLVIFYPLWLGDVPALFKAFLEQVLRPAETAPDGASPFTKKPFAGKSARVVVTMGMPAWVYRWVFGAHSLKNLSRNVLRFVGVGPIRHTLIDMIEAKDPAKRAKWLKQIRLIGRTGH